VGNFFSKFFKEVFSDLLGINESQQTSYQAQRTNNTSSTSKSNSSPQIEANNRIQSANKKINLGKYEEAIIDIEAAIDLCPDVDIYWDLYKNLQIKLEIKKQRQQTKNSYTNNYSRENNSASSQNSSSHSKSTPKKKNGRITTEEKILKLLAEIEEYLANEDIKNADFSLDMVEKLDRAKQYQSEISDLWKEKEKLSRKIKADNLATEAYAKLNSRNFLEAIRLFKMANDLGFHFDDYYKAVAAFEEHKKQKEQKKRQLQNDYAKQAEIHYKNAVQYKDNKNYTSALREIEKAITSARQANLVTNKFVILKNKILADKNTDSDTRTKHNSGRINNKTTSVNNKHANDYQGYGLLDDELDEYVPPNIAEIISNKSGGEASGNKNNSETEDIQIIKNLTSNDFNDKVLEELYNKALSFYKKEEYNSALLIIKEVRVHVNSKKFELLRDEILATKASKQAEELYQKALEKYTSGNFDYNTVIRDAEFAVNKKNEAKYVEFLETVKSEYGKIEAKKYYDKALEYYENQDYDSAIMSIEQALKFDPDNKEYIEHKHKQAEVFYNKAQEELQNKQYAFALDNIITAIELNPDKKYKDFKNNIENQREEDIKNKKLQQAEEFYKQSQEDFQNKYYTLALENIASAIELNPCRKYKDFKNNIEDEYEDDIKNKKIEQAERLYRKAQEDFQDKNYASALENITSAVKLNSRSAYKAFKSQVKKEYEVHVKNKSLKQAEMFYKKSQEDFQDKNYTSALNNIHKAIKFFPDEEKYTDFKNTIEKGYEEDQLTKEFEEYFENGIYAYNDAEFEEAIEYFQKALDLKPNDKECLKLLEKSEVGKIDIMTCTKQALMTLDFIDRETAENIIQARKEGIMWYDYQLFAQQFEIMPHLWSDVEEKIAFPLKQVSKYGRRLDI